MKVLKWILIFLFLFLISISLIIFFAFKEKGVPKNSILKITLQGEIPEYSPASSLPFFKKKKLSIFDYVRIIEDAKDNPKILGLYLRLKKTYLGPGKIEELVSAIEEFKSSGKKTIVYADTFGEFESSNGSIWLASAFEKIYLNPSGYYNLIGINAEVPFIRGTLDKLHIYPDFDHIAEYKTAMNILTEKKFTEAHKEMQESIVNSIFENMVESIGKNRRIRGDELKKIIDLGPLSAEEAKEKKLIDALLYEDELEEKFKEIGGKNYTIINDYEYKLRDFDFSQKIAIIFGIGGIYVGSSEPSPFGDSYGMGSETISKYIRQARKDKSIKAVIFRVDSGGGSAIASEIIRREIILTKKEKPVVVSMGDVAASGGYWVSMSGSSIICQKSTLTGSIGVVVGKFNLKGFFEDLLGITFDSVKAGENADFYSSIKNFSPCQRETLVKMMKKIYEDFVINVSNERKIPKEEVEKIAKGRVWTGIQALKLKLVDKIGGYREAISEAKRLAKIPEKEKVKIVVFPRSKDFFEILFQERKEETFNLIKTYFIENFPAGPLWCPYRIVLN